MGEGNLMRHLKPERVKVSWSGPKKVRVALLCAVLAAIGVFGGFAIWRNGLGYKAASGDTKEILTTKTAVTEFIDGKITSLDFSDDENNRIKNFDEAIAKAQTYMDSLGASSVLKDAAVKEKYDQAAEKFNKIKEMRTVEQTLVALSTEIKSNKTISTDDMTKLESSDNDFLKTLGTDLSNYAKEVADFKTKYGDASSTIDQNAMIEAYGVVQNDGEKLNKKYSGTEFADIFGMSRDDMLSFYDSIETLDKYLTEKI